MIEQLQRTKENWTYGIINIPLLYGHNNKHGVNPKTIIRKVAHNAKCYRKPYPALDKSKRYLWFEQDTRDLSFHNKVLGWYAMKGIDVLSGLGVLLRNEGQAIFSHIENIYHSFFVITY